MKPPLLHVAQRVGQGPPVVLIHGIASSSVTFRNLVPLLQGRHEVIAVDLLGFGGSPVAGCDYTVDDHVAAIVRTLRHARVPRPFRLVGHSMGGLIAARIAARRQRWIAKAVLVSPPIYLSPDQLSRALDRGVMDFYLRAYRYLRENRDFTLRNARVVESFLSIPRAMDINERTWTPFVKSLKNSIEHQTTLSDLAAIRAPVDIVYADFDQFASRGVMAIAERLRGVTVTRVPGSDHLIGRRLAEAVAQAVG